MTTEQQVLLAVAKRPGVCPFCGHQPVVRYLESRTEIQWVVDQACDHLVTQGGQGCDPTFDQPRDWQGVQEMEMRTYDVTIPATNANLATAARAALCALLCPDAGAPDHAHRIFIYAGEDVAVYPLQGYEEDGDITAEEAAELARIRALLADVLAGRVVPECDCVSHRLALHPAVGGDT